MNGMPNEIVGRRTSGLSRRVLRHLPHEKCLDPIPPSSRLSCGSQFPRDTGEIKFEMLKHPPVAALRNNLPYQSIEFAHGFRRHRGRVCRMATNSRASLLEFPSGEHLERNLVEVILITLFRR
jgi:hypothetical protein